MPKEAFVSRLPYYVRIPMSSAGIRLTDASKWVALRNYRAFQALATTPPGIIDQLSARGAIRAAQHARRRVPAYRDFVERSGWKDDVKAHGAERVRLLPEMDKENYIKAYDTPKRCLDGIIPLAGTTMDESSGSSGKPFNWVRSDAELKEVHLQLSQFAKYTFGQEVVTINGFSMGAWATGVNAGEALRMNGLVKSTGPDVDKILSTMEEMGPGYLYVLTGYPPFIKRLLDEGDAKGFDWKRYRAYSIVGGEGMSERLRADIETRVIGVYSAYGASDLDIGVAGETPLSVWIRKRAYEDKRLQEALFGAGSRLPMLFQYNAMDYYVEKNPAGELVITVSRLCMLSPRIRYNIHDAGGCLDYGGAMAVLRDFGLDPLKDVEQPAKPAFKLPFLYVSGRTDSTVSYMGANIYPEDVEYGLYAGKADAALIEGFCLELVDAGDGEEKPCVHVELSNGKAPAGLEKRLAAGVVEKLKERSRDFKTSVDENPRAGDITVKAHKKGTGPFAEEAGRLKRRYVVKGGGVGKA